jgi:cell wall-associated NlpC family hydrolase
MSKIVEIAKKEIGMTESPKNSNKTKYGKWFGYDGVAWCGMFVSWCYDQAGKRLPKIGFTKGFAGCQTAVAYFKKSGEVTTEPQAGDIVFFDWNLDGRHDHTGIFVEWLFKGQTFISIEGNTSSTNQSNGGNVERRTRTVNKGTIFAHPKILDI